MTTVLMAMSRKLKKEATEKQVEVLLYEEDAKADDEDEVEKGENLADNSRFSKEDEEEAISKNKGLLELMDGGVGVGVNIFKKVCW